MLKPIQLNYDGNLYIRAYNSMFSGTSKLNCDEGNGISRDDYKDGYALYLSLIHISEPTRPY